MVFGRRGIGGPQLAEVDRMLSKERAKAASDRAWLKDRSHHLARSKRLSTRPSLFWRAADPIDRSNQPPHLRDGT